MEKETKDKNMYTDEKIKDIAKNLYNLLMAESNEKAKKIMDDKFKTTKSVVEVSTMLPYLLEEFDIEPRMFAIDECCMPFATHLLEPAVRHTQQLQRPASQRRKRRQPPVGPRHPRLGSHRRQWRDADFRCSFFTIYTFGR